MFFWTLIGKFCLCLLSLRYRIRVTGQDQLTPHRLNKRGGVLFLPNHPALMDPFFLYLLFWPRFRMRPLVIDYIYRTPFLLPWMRLVKAIAIPNFDTGVNEFKVKHAEEALQKIVSGLKRKENYVLYPAGKLKGEGKEILGAASGAYNLLQKCPQANVVLIRTTGLWGSKFSRAIEGHSPDLQETLWSSIKALLKNGIFFLPRRDVLIEIEANPELALDTRLDFNQALESWYNRYPDKQERICESEPLRLISYAFWKEEVPSISHKKRRMRESGVVISKEKRERIYAEIQKIIGREEEIQDEQNLSLDLGMDSLNIAELLAFIVRNYRVREVHPEEFDTVQSVLAIAEGAKLVDTSEHRSTSSFSWPKTANRLAPALPVGQTIPEAFLNSCQRMGSQIACGDDLVGPISYSRMKIAAIVLAGAFRKMKGDNIAVLLPASAGAYITILALELAGKVPVMLNWTLGPRYLDEMMRQSGAQVVITSWRFIDRLAHIEFGECLNYFCFLEEIRSNLSLVDRLKGALLAKRSVQKILRALKLDHLRPEDPAVILFTSGTEAAPKGVPLSHKNILTNQRSAMQCIKLEKSDILYGILPPFHSFGFSVAGLFPILAGLKVAFYPDPTDSFALAEGVKRWKVTMFCGAPSFLKGLFQAATLEQLKTIRYIVSGAEKASKELYAAVKKIGAHLLEGYGITECAPILTLNSANLLAKGVGRLLPDVELCTIHPETEEPLAPGAEGEICVRGPNVFAGYLGKKKSPFIKLQGKSWYRTGDLGHLDDDGNLILSGRLKRFAKLGGEMVSLAAIEETLLHHANSGKREASLAICVDEQTASQPRLIVFTTSDLNVAQANKILQSAGFSRLVKIAAVRRVDVIPLLGTGKIDYRTLQSQLK